MDHQQQEGATAPPPQTPSYRDREEYDETPSSQVPGSQVIAGHDPQRNHDGFTPHYDAFMRIVRR